MTIVFQLGSLSAIEGRSQVHLLIVFVLYIYICIYMICICIYDMHVYIIYIYVGVHAYKVTSVSSSFPRNST